MRNETKKLVSGVASTKAKKIYMNMNVILTFDVSDTDGNTQVIFNLRLPLSKKEKNAVAFIHENLFTAIVKKCSSNKQSIKNLIKISAAGDWDLFEQITGKKSLLKLGHDCRWYFGNGRCDLDPWEEKIMEIYGFGRNADMSFITPEWIDETRMMITTNRSTNQPQPSTI